jgi:hypothetical protein
MNDDWMPPFAKIEKLKRIDPEDEINKVLEALPHDHKALELGQAIYRCKAIAWETRWRVGKECLKYETPTLGVVAQVDGNDLAALLDNRLKRIEQIKLEQAKLIEGKPTDSGANGGAEVDARLPPPIPDRRFRRI